MSPSGGSSAWWVALAYLLLVFAIGWWSARRTRTPRDFFIAGQGIGLFVTGLATMSAAFSGFVFLGGPGLTYRIGVGSLFIVLPAGYTAGMLCWVLAGKLRALAGVHEVFTIPDVVALRYPGRAPRGLAAIGVLLGSVAYLGLQIRALGLLLQMMLGLDSALWAMLLGLLVLTLYSAVGGMIAGVYTDVAQGFLMVVGAVVVFLIALRSTGGWGEMTSAIAASETFGPSFLDPLGRIGALQAFGYFFVFGVGVLGQPQMLHKFFMIADARKLRWLPLVLGGSQALCLLIWIGIGLAVPALVASGALAAPARPDEAAPLFLSTQAPELVTGLVFAAIVSAIMSTADSFLNIGSAALVRDLPRALGRRVHDELLWGRLAVFVISALAALFAWFYGDLIAMLGTFAFGVFGAALAPALAVGSSWARPTATAATASIATGLVATVALELLARWGKSPLAEGAVPAAAALGCSLTVFLAVSWWTGASGRCGAAPGVARQLGIDDPS
ncbi:MAG: hypothetical protein GY716_10680 [bacterium]|nr:hypothetical protein [bacterium]